MSRVARISIRSSKVRAITYSRFDFYICLEFIVEPIGGPLYFDDCALMQIRIDQEPGKAIFRALSGCAKASSHQMKHLAPSVKRISVCCATTIGYPTQGLIFPPVPVCGFDRRE